jgi:TetR/AcrR family fatty acid metabolism transcriptional regulator
MDSGKKKAILGAASTIFADKDYGEAKISEIAEAAGVRISRIYKYFKGKEDLLFSIPVDNTEFFIENFKEHLTGIKNSEDKLRKAIWHYLYFHQNNKDYATVVLFKLRPNRKFYQSQAYESFKTYNKIIIDIIREGQEQGVFRRNLNIYLFRNLIFGSFDHTILGWLLFQKPETLIDQAEGLFQLLFSSIKKAEDNDRLRKGEADWNFDKKEAILRTAEAVFAEKGVRNSTISNISQILGIGDATIYEYFKNKEDLLFSIPIERSESLFHLLTENMQIKNEAENQFRKFVWHYLSLFQKNKNYVSILLFELRPNRTFYSSNAYSFFRKCSDILTEIIKKGQMEGTFKKEINIYILRDLIFGSIDHTALTWILFGKPNNLLDEGHELIELYLRAIKSSYP